MSDFVWTNTRDRAIRLFNGQTPRASDEEAIMTAFQEQPALVERTINEVAVQLEQGKITWGWAVTRSRVERALQAPGEIVVESGELAQRTALAEKRMRVVGIHLVSEEQIIDELFGHGALLESWADSTALRDRFLTMWRELRPLGEQVDREAVERGNRHRAARARANASEPPNPLLVEHEANPLLA
jgi:hypothetical protein